MNTIIGVWGAGGSGKTTFATCLAASIYNHFRQESRVAVVYPDQSSPALSYLLPRYKKDSIHSVGMPLSRPVITKTDILKNIVTLKGRKNFGVLGYIDGENVFTYPALESEKVMQFLEVLGEIVDYTVIDCPTDAANAFTSSALKTSDTLFTVVNPNLKSISWSASSESVLSMQDHCKKQVTILNHIRNDINLPDEERLRRTDVKTISIPFSKSVAEMAFQGRLFFGEPDKVFEKAVFDAASETVKKETQSVSSIIPFVFDLENREKRSGKETPNERIGDAI